MAIFHKGPGPHAIAIAMSGVRMGERLLEIGCGSAGMCAAIAGKVGLSGRACAVVDSARAEAAILAAAAKGGLLIDVAVTPWASLPFDGGAFDLTVIDATRGLLAGMQPGTRAQCLREILRVLRVGGRAVVIERTGVLARLFAPRATGSDYESTGATGVLDSAGFKPTRVLAEREGLRFVEGWKPASP